MRALTAIYNDYKKYVDTRSAASIQHLELKDRFGRVIGHDDKDLLYIPTKTGAAFEEDKSFVKVIMGPYGSGKSTACDWFIVRHACAMPVWHKGRRRARWAIVRNTAGELYTTTLQTWLSWFSNLGDITKRQKPVMTYEHVFNDGHGIVELELYFIALDREEDIRKIKSLEVTGVYINELSEVPQAALAHFKGRLNGRYPSSAFCSDPYWSGIIADTNPPDTDHWIYKTFEDKPTANYKLYKQPPGLIRDDDDKWVRNTKCDNYINFKNKDYYEKLAEGQNEDFIKVYCLGEYGTVTHGKVVYPEYNNDFHCKDNIEAIQGSPLYLGWDFGLTPACICAQFTERGTLVILQEFTCEDMGIKTFAESIVLPAIKNGFPYCKIGGSWADPSGVKKDEIMEELSCIGVLNQIGIETFPAQTNAIDARIGAVRYFLNKMIDGKPAFIINKSKCKTLRKGFITDYHYKRVSINNEERYKDTPHKNYTSHPHDALQYIALNFAATQIVSERAPRYEPNIFNPVMRTF